MELSILKGILTGMILSLPFGPVGLYCVELAMVDGQLKAYVTALGMVTIDVFYSSIALLFLSKVEHLVLRYENVLSLFIGLFLMAVAIKKLCSKIMIKEVELEFKSIIQSYFTGIIFAIVNISSIVLLTVIFTGLKVDPSDIREVLLGVFLGGASLWFITTTGITHYKRQLDIDNLMIVIKRVNIALLIFSLIVVIRALMKFIKI